MKVSIEINNLVKNYGNVPALQNINLEVNQGELFGLIGPDGAGKTSLFRILTTLLVPDEGYVRVNGLDVVRDYREIRKNIGYMPGKFSLYQDLSVEENLEFFATAFGVRIKDNYDLIRDIYVQIEPFKNRLAGQLSGGMKQKLALSCALIHKPDILVLDEPTTGVDAVSRKEFWDMLKRLKDEGITIIVSTPYMDEAELCERVSLIQKGEILRTAVPAEITDNFNKTVTAIKSDNLYQLLRSLQGFEGTYSVFPFGEYLHLILKSGYEDHSQLNSYLANHDNHAVEIREISAGIEDVFMDLMTKIQSDGQ